MDGDDTDQDTTLDSRRFVDGADGEDETTLASTDEETPRTDSDRDGAGENEDTTSAIRGSATSSPTVDIDAETDGAPTDSESPVLDDVVLDDVGSEDADEASQGLFDDLLAGDPIFESKEVVEQPLGSLVRVLGPDIIEDDVVENR